MFRLIILYKIIFKKVKIQQVLDGCTNFLVMIIELIRFLNRTYCFRNQNWVVYNTVQKLFLIQNKKLLLEQQKLHYLKWNNKDLVFAIFMSPAYPKKIVCAGEKDNYNIYTY